MEDTKKPEPETVEMVTAAGRVCMSAKVGNALDGKEFKRKDGTIGINTVIAVDGHKVASTEIKEAPVAKKTVKKKKAKKRAVKK